MHNSKPFSSTVLINIKAGIYSGIQDTYIKWQDWQDLTPQKRDLEVEKVVRKYHLRDGLEYNYEVASLIPGSIICAAVWYKLKALEIEKTQSSGL